MGGFGTSEGNWVQKAPWNTDGEKEHNDNAYGGDEDDVNSSLSPGVGRTYIRDGICPKKEPFNPLALLNISMLGVVKVDKRNMRATMILEKKSEE